MARTADPEQLTGELIQLGTVASVSGDTCTVDLGDLITGDLPWLAGRAGRVRIWSPPTIGEQCAVLAPEGDLAGGVVLLGIYSDARPSPSSDPDAVVIEFDDGAALSYNLATHALDVTLPGGSAATVTADDLTINGNVRVNGKLDVTEDVVGGGISLKNHKHTGVTAGGAQSGTPV
ncbi:phage baseplate assembly protein V [Novosphingobium sp. HII-3]|uniref:phage baseplate assembly protein V n=1 Tax=Novosphingobium sp. HII-3 TaxID=2075565 RepID=UPI000CDB4F26|nr:phage baseplate assembly protein V [Novosphingobium sp. HII-3]